MDEKQKPVMHLMVTNRCHLNCLLCCNKQYNIDEIPVATVEDLKGVDTICITGGEPFLCKSVLDTIIIVLRRNYPNIENLYIYTTGQYMAVREEDHYIDGFSIGPKTRKDWENLLEIYRNLKKSSRILEGSNRLYVFPEYIKMFDAISTVYPDFKDILNVEIHNRKWQKEFKPAPDTIFRRLPMLY